MLFQFLDHLRTKPKPLRQRYAFSFALLFTALIGSVWAFTLPARFAVEENSDVAAAGSAPFAGLWQQFKDQVSAVRTTPAATEPVATATPSTATTTQIDAVDLISTTTSDGTRVALQPAPKPVLIGTTTSATVSTTATTTVR